MSRPCPERGVELLTVAECQEVFGKSKRSVRGAMGRLGVYVEHCLIEHEGGNGASKKAFIDPQTVQAVTGWTPLKPLRNDCTVPGGSVQFSGGSVQFPAADSEAVCNVGEAPPETRKTELIAQMEEEGSVQFSRGSVQLPETSSPTSSNSSYSLSSPQSHSLHTRPDLTKRDPAEVAKAERKHQLLQPLATLTADERARRFQALATSGELGVRSTRSVRRLYTHLREGREIHGHVLKGTAALLRSRRADKGTFWIPEALLGLVMGAILANPRATPARVRRIIELSDPHLLIYRSRTTKRPHTLSTSTIKRIRKQMKHHFPAMRLALLSADEIKEFRRVWAGSVLAARAAQLWEADFTTCDTFVVDPYAEKIKPFRMTIFAAIDIYSGAVPAMIFSRAEDQAAANLMIVQAVHPKPDSGGWNERWRVYGRPERLYTDNGSVFVSEAFRDLCHSLGIETTNSLVGSSHTRGKIERLFGTFHQTFEKILPGYGGEDVVRRDSLELERLRENTVRWLQGGGPEPYPDRLLTEQEFKRSAMNWLTADYHQRTVNGKTHEQHYMETAPLVSFAHPDLDELRLLASERLDRKIYGNGAIRYQNRFWVPNRESLFRWQEGQAVLLVDRLIPGHERLTIARELPNGDLYIHGLAVPLEGSALSEANVAYRAQSREESREVEGESETLKQFTDPERTHTKALEKASRRESAPLVIKPAPRAKLAALNPEDAYAKQLEADRQAVLEEGLKLDWDVEIPERRKE